MWSGLPRRSLGEGGHVRMEMTRLLVLVLTASIVGCDGEPPRTPTQPSLATPPSGAVPLLNPLAPTPIRTITLKTNDRRADLDFGDVEPGGEVTKTLEVCNDGNSALSVSRIEGPAGYSSSAYQEWYSDPGPAADPNALFFVAPGHCWEAWSTFQPTTSGNYTGIITVIANHTSGTNTIPVRGNGVFPAVPRRVFGEGAFVVGKGIAPDRYYTDPNGWCSWGRAAKYSPGEDIDFIAWNEPWFDSGQWIVDILPSDALFSSGGGCGWWDRVPRRVASKTVIQPGMWLVDKQIEPGRFRAAAMPGCHWERLRHFQGTPKAIIASGSIASGGNVTVDIHAGDEGFHANAACGPWTREK